jgi:hypothetical protein
VGTELSQESSLRGKGVGQGQVVARNLLQTAVSGLVGSVLAVAAQQQAPELQLIGQAPAQSPVTGSGNDVVFSCLFVPEHTPTPPEPLHL